MQIRPASRAMALAALIAAALLGACTPDLVVGGLDASRADGDAGTDARCDAADARACIRDMSNDSMNCGTVGNICPAGPHGSAACVAGHCQLVCEPHHADCDGLTTNGCEISTGTDVNNCGACGSACRGATNALPLCESGVCGLDCNSGYFDCDQQVTNGCETNITLPIHCGGCMVHCADTTPLCSTAQGGYSCTASCAMGSTQCGQTCVDTQSDANNCGACGHVCPAMAGAAGACVAGACTITCNQGYADCNSSLADGCETNVQTDATHCGACGTTCTAPAHATAACSGGSCSFICGPGTHACGGTCQDNTSVTSCGTNCAPCTAPPNASPTCDGITCGFTCNPGYADCDHVAANGCEASLSSNASCGACGVACSGSTPACSQSGSAFTCTGGCTGTTPTQCGARCVSTQSDPSNCGGCGVVCPSGPNSSATCANGMCGLACNPGFGNCDGAAANGCEVNLQSSTSHCGTCTTSCPNPPNGSSVCSAGGCASTCSAGYHLCGSTCSSDSSVSSCGSSCGACPAVSHATPTCNGSSCGYTCTSGWADCNGSASDGCETDTNNSPYACGSCGNSCGAPANGSAGCSGGGCTVACNGGFHACGASCVDNNSTASCGGSCSPCSPPANSTSTCNGSSCGYTCNPGWADCNGSAGDGCESNLGASGTCGSCGNACSGSYPMCQGGTCVSGCGAQPLCGGNCVDTSSDPSNCGSCGNVCPSGPNSSAYCSGGTCGLTCAGGFGNCNGVAGDGCETALNSLGNCGGCGVGCPSGPGGTASCSPTGTCTFTCDAGFGDCNNNIADGCETDFSFDDQFNCGYCGHRCAYCCIGGACAGSRICLQ